MFNCPLRSVLSLSLTARPLQQFPLDLHMNRHQENSCQGFHWHGNHNNGRPGGPTTQQSFRGVRGQKRRGQFRRYFKDNQSSPHRPLSSIAAQASISCQSSQWPRLVLRPLVMTNVTHNPTDRKSSFSGDKHLITLTKGIPQFKYNSEQITVTFLSCCQLKHFQQQQKNVKKVVYSI